MAARPRGPYRRVPNAVIRPEQGQTIRDAAEAAKRVGWPLDRLITLNFYFTDCAPEDMPRAFEYIRDMAVRWYRYETLVGRIPSGDEFAFVWALEHVGEYHHVHWLVHLPARSEKRFLRMLERWTLRAAGIARPRYLDIKPFDHMGPVYLTKGMAPEHFVGPPTWRTRRGGQGQFHGKRCGVSANLKASSGFYASTASPTP